MNLLLKISIVLTVFSAIRAQENGYNVTAQWDVEPPASLTGKKQAGSSNVEKAVVITKEQADEIVQRHNFLRTIVQPSASKMRKMTWDDELARVSTTYSRKCIYEHNKERKHSRFRYIGENLYISMGRPMNTAYLTNAVSAWDNEKVDYDYETRKCKPGKKCGHYTQTAWDDTFKVGCGVTTCQKVEVNGKIWEHATLFACNYGPGGNYDRHPFIAGTPCSACDEGDSCEKKLCVNSIRDIDFDAGNAAWSEWSAWSTCSTTCFGGTAKRSRKCNTFVSSDCPGYSSEMTFSCSSNMCDLNPLGPEAGDDQFLSWGEWSKCSATCGNGQSIRLRKCKNSNACSGVNKLMISCNLGSCTTAGGGGERGTWTTWGRWNSCSVTCGGGVQKKKRTCRGSRCPGRSADTRTCNPKKCKIAPKWAEWTSWTSCSESCGGGSRTKVRRCFTGRNCEGSTETTDVCNTNRCPGRFSAWTAWTDCSKTCGPGIRKRTRTCVGGRDCQGSRVERDRCSSGACPVFDKWTSWGPCDVTCGSGNRLRTRNCSTSKPDDCEGENSQVLKCAMDDCTTSGWSPWTPWSKCSVTCGGGERTGRRVCNVAKSGERVCPGNNIRTSSCRTMKCPEYGGWSSWSACDATCGEGTQTRVRECQYGSDCDGPSSETVECKFSDCTKSEWAPWSTWSSCSESCGDGTRSRKRVCSLGDKGPPCAGDNDEARKCKVEECKVDKPDEKDKPNEKGKDPDSSDQAEEGGDGDGAMTVHFSALLCLASSFLGLFLLH